MVCIRIHQIINRSVRHLFFDRLAWQNHLFLAQFLLNFIHATFNIIEAVFYCDYIFLNFVYHGINLRGGSFNLTYTGANFTLTLFNTWNFLNYYLYQAENLLNLFLAHESNRINFNIYMNLIEFVVFKLQVIASV